MHANHYMQNYDAKTIPAPLGSCINEIYAKFWSRNIQQGITNDGLLHSGFQHQLVVLNHFVWWRSIGAFTFFSDRFYRQYQENRPHISCCTMGLKPFSFARSRDVIFSISNNNQEQQLNWILVGVCNKAYSINNNYDLRHHGGGKERDDDEWAGLHKSPAGILLHHNPSITWCAQSCQNLFTCLSSRCTLAYCITGPWVYYIHIHSEYATIDILCHQGILPLYNIHLL